MGRSSHAREAKLVGAGINWILQKSLITSINQWKMAIFFRNLSSFINLLIQVSDFAAFGEVKVYFLLYESVSKYFIRMDFEDSASQLPKHVGGKLFWSTAMDDCMLEVFLNHLAQGRRSPSGWKKATTYHAIKEALRLNLSMDVTISEIENRVKTMRNQTMAFKTLNSSCSSFGWDSDTMLLTADVRVWDEALKANPNLKNYKKKLLPRFNEWMDVLGDNLANGNIQKTCFTVDVDDHEEDSIEMTTKQNSDPFLGSSMTFETINLDEDGGTEYASSPTTLPEPARTIKLPQRKRKSLAMGLKEEMGNMRATMENFVDILKEKSHYDDIIWDKISAAIYSIEEMNEDTKVEALALFSGEHVENKKRFFLRIPEHKRRGWLLKELGQDDE